MNFYARLIAGVIPVLVAGCWGSGTSDDKSSKEDAFLEVIGLSPPDAVSDIRSSYYYMRDSYIRWLRFSCDADTLKLIESRLESDSGGSPRWTPGFEDRSKNPNAPDWWWELEGIGSFHRMKRTVSFDHTSDMAYVWIDPTTHTVFAMHSTID